VTTFDYGVLLILGASVLLGAFRGLVKELLSLIAYVIAFICALRYGQSVYLWLGMHLENSMLRFVIAYAGVFLAVLMAIGLINLTLTTLLKATGLGGADRGLGAVFGVARGILIILVLVIVAGFTPFPQESWWTNARFSPLAEQGVKQIKPYLPEAVADLIRY